MKFSWSHKLFFKANSLVGQSKTFDWFILFCANWLIYLVGFGVFTWAEFFLDPEFFGGFVKITLTALFFSIATSWIIGWLWPHRRPIVEFPEIKQLIKPYKTWKALPSDHTTIVFVFVFASYWFGAPLVLVGCFFVMGWLVGIARVFAGLHYPRDILAGFFIALFYSVISFWLITKVTQPLYGFVVSLF